MVFYVQNINIFSMHTRDDVHPFVVITHTKS